MAPVPQVQGYKARLLIGGVQYPCYPGASFYFPRNYVAPPIIGNYWSLNYSQGYQQPVVELSFVVEDTLDKVLSPTFLNYWLARSNDTAHDTGVIAGGIDFWDGQSGFNMAGAKADSFMISSGKGDDIRFTGRFCGTTVSALGSAPSFSAWSTAPLMRFQNVTFLTGVTAIANIWNFNLGFSNNHTPDNALDGTFGPAAMNAGMQEASFSSLQQTAASYIDNDPAGGGGTTGGLSLVFTGPSSGNICKFTLGNLLDNTANNRTVSYPRVMRQHSYLCLGVDGQTTPPLVLASSNFHS